MSKYVLSVCISLFITTIISASAVRLILGPTQWEGIIAILFFLLPAVILLFAAFIYLAEKLLRKYADPLIKYPRFEIDFESHSKIIAFIGYVEIISGLLFACVSSWILIAYKFTPLNFLILIFSFLIFSSGYLLVKKSKIGIILSIISQAATIVNFITPEYMYYFGNLLNFTIGFIIGNSRISINVVSIVFFVVLLINIKRQPNNSLQQIADATAK